MLELAGGLAPTEVSTFVGAVSDLEVEVGCELMGALQGRVVQLAPRFNAQDVLGLIHAFWRMGVEVTPELGASLQRQALLAVDRYPHSAMPTLLRAVAGMRAPPNRALLDQLQESATGAAHLFTAQEVVVLVQAKPKP